MYQETINKIKKVSAETKSAIARKSAQTLPINPSERGMSAEEIKRRFYQPITDTVNSALAEIDRLVDEINETNSQLKGNMDAFVEKSLIKEPYKVNLTDKWQFNENNGMFEVVVTAEEHGITKYDEIGVDLYLLDGQGKYTSVNQFEVLSDASVRIFHETNGAGYVNIYIKREGYIESVQAVDVHRVIGISKVGVSNNYEDLDNLPNLDIMLDNEEMISKMIAGTQPVNKALNADKAIDANYAATSGTADKATTAESADKATKDQHGVNISDGYCKQNGTYANLKAGKASVAEKAVADENGVNIQSQYAKKNGTYPDFTAGKATRAVDADSADLAKKATADSNGANIANTYATKSGNHPNMTVGKATNADLATEATKAQYIKFVTTAPTAAPPADCLLIYTGDTVPTTRYDRVVYLIGY